MDALQMETMLKAENKEETMEVMQILGEMTPAQKSEMLIFANGFLHGVRSASDKNTSKAAAVQTV